MKGKLYFFLAIFWIVIVFTFFMVRLNQEAATIPYMDPWDYYSEWGYLHDYYVDDIDSISIKLEFHEMPDTVKIFWTSSYLLFLNKEENDSVLISFEDLKKCFKK